MNMMKFLKANTLKNMFYNIPKFNFARGVEKTVPIYPGDKVVVLPVWGSAKLNRFARKVVMAHNKEATKLQYGTVKRFYRKKRLVKVTGVNRKAKYTSPYSEHLFDKMEKGNLDKIKRQVTYLPVNLDRIRLVDANKKIIAVKMIKNEAGEKVRINTRTKEEVPIKLKFRTYAERTKNKKEGPRDTPDEIRMIKTYKGENFEMIAKRFIEKIKRKEEIESHLVLKD
jgi:hypothetical protein